MNERRERSRIGPVGALGRGYPVMIPSRNSNSLKVANWALAVLSLVWASGCGIPAIDASKVKQLDVVSYEANTFCPTERTKLDVQAKMTDGSVRATSASDRSNQFDAATLDWQVTPAVGKVASSDLDVAFVPNDDVSPVLDGNVSLTVAMKGNQSAKGAIELAPNFACNQAANFSAADGAQGSYGSRGDSLWTVFLKSSGRSGGSGENGSTGDDGTHVEAYVKLVNTPKHGTLAAVRVTRAGGGRAVTYYVDPAKGHIAIVNRGGRGGEGGAGELGTSGSYGGSCERGGDGGSGGYGGNGGDGGTGGTVTVHIEANHPELAPLVSVDNRGGEGGAGGSGGRGGTGGSGGVDTKKKCNPSDGRSGQDGSSGMPGRRGMSGPAAQIVLDPAEQVSL